MSATSRVKVTIEELKKLFSKGRKPSEEDFAKLIDTLNDEVEEGTYYTQDEINVIVEKLASTDDLNTLSDLMEELEYIVGGKANEVHSHIEYVKINLGFAICSSVLGLITLSIFITLCCLSFNNLCLDDFYTELYQYYGKKNTDVKYFALIQSIMLFVPCITFIIFCKTNKKENEINKIDDNALANDENEAAAPIIS